MASVDHSAGADSSGSRGEIELFIQISVPTFSSIKPPKVTNSLKERQRYKFEVDSKIAEVPLLCIAFFHAHINRPTEEFVFYGCLPWHWKIRDNGILVQREHQAVHSQSSAIKRANKYLLHMGSY